jgi:putative hydrolase of the HAD superfamily
MKITIPGTIVLFDYGEVISSRPSESDRAELLMMAGADAGPFWAAYWHHRDAYDRGTIRADEYWTLIGGDVGCDWDEATRHQLWLLDFRSWLVIDPGTLAVLVDLRRGGTRMALLSNAGPEFASWYRDGMLGDFFDVVVASSDIGVLKPHPASYHAVLTALDASPRQLLFVDDRPTNVRGAEAVGIAAHRFVGAADLRAWLERVAAGGSEQARPEIRRARRPG